MNFYFHDYSCRNTYGFETTETASAIARYLAPRSKTSYVYLLGSNLFLDHATIGFIDRLPEGVDVARGMPVAGLPSHGALRHSVFLALPDRFTELSEVERARPGGRSLEVRSSYQGRVMFRAYEVPAQPAQPEGAGGGEQRRARNSGQVSSRPRS